MKECGLCHHTTSNNLNHFVLINVNCLAPSHLLFIGDCNLICLHTIVGVRNAQCASAVQFVGLQAQEQDLFHQLKCQHCNKQWIDERMWHSYAQNGGIAVLKASCTWDCTNIVYFINNARSNTCYKQINLSSNCPNCKSKAQPIGICGMIEWRWKLDRFCQCVNENEIKSGGKFGSTHTPRVNLFIK